jgi:phosphoribosylanthranilate isomerase
VKLFDDTSGHTRIKFCGLTRAEDVDAALALDIDAIGFVFAARSKRRVDIAQAVALRSQLPATVAAVVLLMDNPEDDVRAIVDAVRPDLLQFHGSEDDAFCAGFGLPWMKAIAMAGADTATVQARLDAHPRAQAFLLDSHAAGAGGGTGHRFDWSQIPQGIDRPWFLAGGLDPDNVFDAVRRVRPWGVDVSSGIEASGIEASGIEAGGIERAPGIKDAGRMRAFAEHVRRADRARRDMPLR